VPVRRRRSIFSIIGMIVVLGVLLVVVYFAYVGWSSKGKPTPDVDVKTSAVDPSATPGTSTPAAPVTRRA
jgi:flagellar basal body-associated protein FliL